MRTPIRDGLKVYRDRYYCYDVSWRLTNLKTGSCGGTTVMGLGYDDQGNLTNKNGQDFDFDLGNRLRAADGLVNYRYAGHGRRASALSASCTVYSFSGHDATLRSQPAYRRAKDKHFITTQGRL